MAKREREEEFEVSEVAPLQPLSLAFSYGRLHSPLSVQCYTVQQFLPMSVLNYTTAVL